VRGRWDRHSRHPSGSWGWGGRPRPWGLGTEESWSRLGRPKEGASRSGPARRGLDSRVGHPRAKSQRLQPAWGPKRGTLIEGGRGTPGGPGPSRDDRGTPGTGCSVKGPGNQRRTGHVLFRQDFVNFLFPGRVGNWTGDPAGSSGVLGAQLSRPRGAAGGPGACRARAGGGGVANWLGGPSGGRALIRVERGSGGPADRNVSEPTGERGVAPGNKKKQGGQGLACE